MACPDMPLWEYYAYGQYDDDLNNAREYEYSNAKSYENYSYRNRHVYERQHRAGYVKSRLKGEKYAPRSKNYCRISSAFSTKVYTPTYEQYSPINSKSSSNDSRSDPEGAVKSVVTIQQHPQFKNTFSEGPSDNFLNSIEKHFAEHGTPEEHKLKIALSALRGTAELWYECVRSNNHITDFPSFKEQLLFVFPRRNNQVEKETEIYSQRQQERKLEGVKEKNNENSAIKNFSILSEFKSINPPSQIAQAKYEIKKCTLDLKTPAFRHTPSLSIKYEENPTAIPILVELKNVQKESLEILQSNHHYKFAANVVRSSKSYGDTVFLKGVVFSDHMSAATSLRSCAFCTKSGVEDAVKSNGGLLPMKCGAFCTTRVVVPPKALRTVRRDSSIIPVLGIKSEMRSKIVLSCKRSAKMAVPTSSRMAPTTVVLPEVPKSTTDSNSTQGVLGQPPEPKWETVEEVFKPWPLLQYKYRRKR